MACNSARENSRVAEGPTTVSTTGPPAVVVVRLTVVVRFPVPVVAVVPDELEPGGWPVVDKDDEDVEEAPVGRESSSLCAA
jgi:hypothetical protein